MEKWLEELHLELYLRKLWSAGFHDLRGCSTLTDSSLSALGVLPGHRKRILMNLPQPNASTQAEDESVYVNTSMYGPMEGNEIYDVPVMQEKEASSSSDTEELYVNISNVIGTKKPGVLSHVVPNLPPKKKSNRDSVDEMLGTGQTEDIGKKPIPAPRKTVRSSPTQKLKDFPLSVSIDSALGSSLTNKSERNPRPTPKPRLRKGKSSFSNGSLAVRSEEDLQLPSLSDTNNVEVSNALDTLDNIVASFKEELLPTASPVDQKVNQQTDCVEKPPQDMSPHLPHGPSDEREDHENIDSETLKIPAIPTRVDSKSVASTTRDTIDEVSGQVPLDDGVHHLQTQLSLTESEPGYESVWLMNSGETRKPAARPEDLVFQMAAKTPLGPVLSFSEYSPTTRQSIISFSEPPPDFTPPPLPEGVRTTHFFTLPEVQEEPPMASSTAGPPPPVIPPRPKNYLPSPSKEQSRPVEFSSLRRKPSEKPPNICAVDEPAIYDTPADAQLSIISTVSDDNVYSQVPGDDFDGDYAPVEPRRDSPLNFADFTKSRTQEGDSEGASKHSPSIPNSERLSRQVSRTSESNIYVDGPIHGTMSPPPPPPRGHKHPEPPIGSCVAECSGSKNLADVESDDTLSDGGDFLEGETELQHLRPSMLQTSIPIVPATPTALKERKGHLYKLPSRRNQKHGWRKRWVTFDNEELKYFSDNKSVISKRIIPVATIVNVEQQIKSGDVHPYEFKMTTVDRIYKFATDDSDDLAMWTSILMRAIIDSKPEGFQEGGSMHNPDKEGFVRMEGLRGRQYLVIKKDKFCYYNTFSDYKVATPIHRVELQLASVKDGGKNKLLLMTPKVSFGLLCESEVEMHGWKEAFEEGIAEGLGDDTIYRSLEYTNEQILREVHKNHSNRLCADCGAPDPHWASINLGVTLCKQCAGVHRMLSMPLSKVRSLRMDFRVWTPTLIQMLQKIGNDNSNNFWEWHASEEDQIDSDADMSSRQEYTLAKYQEKRFCHFHPLRSDLTALNEALCKSVQYGDILETIQLLFSGADILCTSNLYGGQSETPLQLSRKAKQTLQVEFLYQNGAEGSGQFPITTSILARSSLASHSSHFVSMKGYLYKQSTTLKEFGKRWFVLEHGTLSYFENEKSTIAKERVERKEMMSIAVTSDEKYEFAFELSTTKNSGRLYTMAADTLEDRHHWMVKIAKSFAPLPQECLEKINDLDRGGIVFLREGATTDSQLTWMHLKGRRLFVFKKDEQEFDGIDLRKVTGISKFKVCGTQTLQRTDICLESFDEGPPFVLDLPNRALYLQGDIRRETEGWHNLLQKVTTESGNQLEDQQLTADNVPVIVDKCLNFISAHGMRSEGLYRKSGQHSKVTQLLEDLKSNAQNVFLSLETYEVQEVATALKRLFRTMEVPLLTAALYPKWISTSGLSDAGAKLQWYKYLLGVLPCVHYNTLKRLMTHLGRVADHEMENKMSALNIASIFGPILMVVDKDQEALGGGYRTTNQEISTILDLINNNQWLFEVKDDELEHERKIQEALEKIEKASRASQFLRESLRKSQGHMTEVQAGDLLMGIYIGSKEGDVVTLKVPATMTAQELMTYIKSKKSLDPDLHWGIFEVVCQGVHERPLHFLERVLDVTLRWTNWPQEFCQDSYLCVKNNYIYEKVALVFDPHFSMFNEFKYSEKKGFRKFFFEFSKYRLSYQKDTRAANPVAVWDVEDLVIYMGVDPKRSPPTKWGFTFTSNKERIVKTRDSPFFGHSISCQSEEELYRWLAAMLHAQHPGGLVPEGAKCNSNLANEPRLPTVVEPEGATGEGTTRPTRNKSLLQRIKNNRW